MEKAIEFLNKTDINNGDVIITSLIISLIIFLLPYIFKLLGLLLKPIYKKYFENTVNKLKASYIENKEKKKQIRIIEKIVKNNLKEYVKENEFKLGTYSAYAYLDEKRNKTKKEKKMMQYIRENEKNKIQEFENIFWGVSGQISKYFDCKDVETIYLYLMNKDSLSKDEYEQKLSNNSN